MTDSLREALGRAFLARFEDAYVAYNESYNPDTVWEAVDDALAALATSLLGQDVEPVRFSGIIGCAGFRTEPSV